MPTNVQVPGLGESVSEAVLVKWHKQDGQAVSQDEPICELETDKANVDLPSPAAGAITRVKPEGAKVRIGETIATIDPNAKPATTAATPSATPAAVAAGSAAPAPARVPPPKPTPAPAPAPAAPSRSGDLSPAVRRLVEENHLDPATISPTGPGG